MNKSLDGASIEEHLAQIGEALSLKSLLERLLEAGLAHLGCQSASAFLFNPATGRLEMEAMLPVEGPPLSFASGEGLAGWVWQEKKELLAQGNELDSFFLQRGPYGLRHRAVFAYPLVDQAGSGGVLCFDFLLSEGSGSGALDCDELRRVASLADALGDQHIRNAMRRARVVHGHAVIREAGGAQYRLRAEIGTFLEGFTTSFEGTEFLAPDLVYLQMVDRRQGKIRTIQGYGQPLSAQVSISHELACSPEGDEDIQSFVARTGNIELIAGFDRRFDKAVFERYGHASLSRLWFPLFPFPVERATKWDTLSLPDELQSSLVWAQEESDASRVRRTASWEGEYRPPKGLIFGTLEVGYRRRPGGATVNLFPWTEELARFCIAMALVRAEKLFRVTLPGSLDTIAREASGLLLGTEAREVSMSVTLPDRSSSERRTYPVDVNAAAEPILMRRDTMGPTPLLKWEYEPPAPSRDAAAKKLKDMTEGIAHSAVRVALRLDDQLVDAFSLIELVEEPSASTGTAWPDEWLEQFCRDAAREAGAASAEVFLFEGPEGKATVGLEPSELTPILPFSSSEATGANTDPGESLNKQVRRVATTGKPAYPVFGTGTVALVPLELAGELTAVVNLRFGSGVFDAENAYERFLVESRVVRWVHRLSLRHLVTAERFAGVLSALTKLVVSVRDSLPADGEERLVALFSRELLRRLSEELSERALPARAGILTLATPEISTPWTFERFWRVEGIDGSHRSLREEQAGPCQRAMTSGEVLVYPPCDARRVRETDGLRIFLPPRGSVELTGGGVESIARLRSLLFGEATECTLVVIPATADAALTLVLDGNRCFASRQKALFRELGLLVGRVLNEVRQEDRRWLAKQATGSLEWRAEIDKGKTITDVLSSAIDVLGRMKPRRNDGEPPVALASKGVVWLLARDLSELVPRVWWGFAEGRYPTGPVEARKHPLLEREWANIAKPKREYPRLTKPVPMAVYAAGEAGMPAFFEAGEGETGRWWVSAPISGADGRLAGVLDLLVEEPFLPDVHEVVTDLTRRLGRQVVAALARTHLERCEGLARRLNRVAAGKIRSYQLQSLWQELAEACREEMVAASCDLFLRYSGSIVLRATTRSGPDITKFNPLDLWIAECQGGEPVGTAISGKRPLIARNRPSIGSNSHISPPLAQLLSRPEGEDWLVVPLVAEAETQASSQSPQGLAHPPERPVPPRDAASREPASSCEGVLVLRGPFLRHPRASVVEKDWNSKPDQGDVDLGMGLGRVIQRVARVALVVEEQNLLINEMVHSLAHPLEGLRGLTEDLLRDLAASGAAGARDLAAGSSGVRDAFQLIEESRDQLGLLAKLGGPLILGPPENLDLRAMVRDCCRTWRSLAAGRNVRIYRDLEASMPTVPGYKRWLRQAISNVIHNAIKYSFSNREVSVSLRRGKESAFLTVTNYGVGIPREDVSKVFDLYFRSRVPDAKGQREGMGVGLAVADQAVRLHGGKITIKSQPREKREAADRTSEKSTIGPTAEDIVDVEHRTEVVLEISQERRGRV